MRKAGETRLSQGRPSVVFNTFTSKSVSVLKITWREPRVVHDITVKFATKADKGLSAENKWAFAVGTQSQE